MTRLYAAIGMLILGLCMFSYHRFTDNSSSQTVFGLSHTVQPVWYETVQTLPLSRQVNVAMTMAWSEYLGPEVNLAEYTLMIDRANDLCRPTLELRTPVSAVWCNNQPDETINLPKDASRIIGAVLRDVRQGEAPTIELFDLDGTLLYAAHVPWTSGSISPGRSTTLALAGSSDSASNTLLTSFTRVRVSGACTAQNERMARVAEEEWLAMQAELLDHVSLVMTP